MELTSVLISEMCIGLVTNREGNDPLWLDSYTSVTYSMLNNAYRLRNTPYGIRQQFPREIEDRRRELYPIQKEAKRQGKRVALIPDRLYKENELYVPAEEIDEAGDFDTPLQPHNVWSTPRNSGDRRPPKRQ